MQSKTSNNMRSLPSLVLSLFFALGAAGGLISAQAASPSIWDGGGANDNWNNSTNWGGNVPVPGTTYDLQFAGTTRLTPNNDFTALSNFRHITFNAGAGAFTLTGNSITLNGHLTNNSSSLQTINLPITTGAGRFVATPSGNITLGGAISGNGGLHLAGSGTVTLGGKNTYTNYTYVNGGILVLPTGGAIKNAYYVFLGQNAGQNGALNITGGTLTNSQATDTGNFMIGRAGYGSLNLSSGTVKVNQVYVGWTGGTGTALINGGSLYCGTASDYVVVANSTGTGVLTVKDGLFSHANANRTFSLNNNGVGRAELNMLGGILNNSGGAVSYGYNTALATVGTGAGIVNLNGGSLMLNRFVNQKQSYTAPGDNGSSYLNFNGGTLTATANNASSQPALTFSSNFIPALVEIRVNGAFGTFAGGAVIDTAGQSCLVEPPLLAPTGEGVSTLPVSDGGAGYIGAPYVSITGDGTGATAIANMVDDGTGKGTFKIGSITVCTPGVNYTAGNTTFSFVGGAPTTPATPSAVTTVANTSGGLTKTGAGTLTLMGANTYTGATVVNVGRLIVSSAHNGGGSFTAKDGAAFGAVRDPATTALVTPSLTLGTTTGAEVDFVLPDGTPTAQVMTVGTLTLNGTNNVSVSGAGFTAGDRFPLIKYTTLAGDPGSLTNGVLNPPDGTLGYLIHNPGNSSFDLKITAVSSQLKWVGTVNSGGVGAWDNLVTTNWISTNGVPKVFIGGADVTLDDTATGVTTVGLVGNIEPASVLVDNSSKNYILGGTGSLVGTMNLTKSGTGTLTITNANTYSGVTTVNGGTLAFAGSLATSAGIVTVDGGTLATSGAINTGTGAWTAGSTAASRGVINVNGGSDIQLAGNFIAGNNASGSGAVNITGGSLTNTQASLAANFEIGLTGYGALNMSGGNVKVNTFYVDGGAGTGVALISGGAFYCGTTNDYVLVGASTGTGVLTVSGGILNHAGANRTISVNNSGDAHGELNLLGGAIDNTGGGVSYGYNPGSSLNGTGVVNLNGGNLTLNRFINKKQTGQNGTTGNSYLNFNGGTLTASASTLTSPSLAFSSDFLPVLTGVYVNGAFGTFAGGAVIDTAGETCIVDSALLAPTGNGISALAVADGGSGYIGAPYVSIGGDGAGATAIANMISDGNGALKVGSVTVCNPGVNYTSAIFSFSGGAPTTPASPGAATTAANTSGGLTKNGAGTLTLQGTNTYTGATTVNGGILRVNGSLDAGSAVTVLGGALGGTGVIGGPVSVQPGGTLSPGASIGILSINNTLALAAGSTTFVEVNASSSGSDLVQGITTANYGGTLVVSNTAGTLTQGQTFQLFSAIGHNYNFASIQSAGSAATWSFNPTNGVLTVLTAVATTPTNITFGVSGTTLGLTWPSSHLGWYAQSNSVSVADSAAWHDIADSQLGTNLNITINPAMGQVFYRLRNP
jgi:fibronectin-binding autotransporter adhesin